MQIDGHHAGTYVTARLAGFDHIEAEVIAYAAQYVDDATNDGPIRFFNSEFMYARIASAHEMIDYNNLLDVENHLAWLPFHFLPGNSSLPQGSSPDGSEISKLACCPDSYVARDMLRMALRDRDKPRGLHRLGIAMHVYADTFAHQGFIGAINRGNHAEDVTSGDPELDMKIRAVSKKSLWRKAWNGLKAIVQLVWTSVVAAIRERKSLVRYWLNFFNSVPLGHAAVDTFPDQPHLVWQYLDWTGKAIKRNNPETFMQAFDMMVKAMQAWRACDQTMNLAKYPGMSATDAAAMKRLVHEETSPVGEERHLRWCEAIAKGVFSFGPETLSYQGKGEGSWKDVALGCIKRDDTGYETYEYSAEFLFSHWKQFHDALQAHRIDVVHEVLPQYGICAA